jgi:CRP/FNR family transcriptional regulator, cyclic AMP receptor protein
VGRFGNGRANDPRAAVGFRGGHGWLGLDRLPPADRDAVLDASRLLRVGRDEALLRSGDDTTMHLLSGATMVRSRSSSGDSTVLRILAPGESWGWAAALAGGFSADVETVADSSALVTSGPALRQLIRERPAIARACLQSVTEELAELQDETARFHNTSTTDRVVHRLLQLADAWGRPVDRGIRIILRLTQEDLASWARASRESTTKALQELRTGGIISTSRREITILDPGRLQGRSTTAERNVRLVDPPPFASPLERGGLAHSLR